MGSVDIRDDTADLHVEQVGLVRGDRFAQCGFEVRGAIDALRVTNN